MTNWVNENLDEDVKTRATGAGSKENVAQFEEYFNFNRAVVAMKRRDVTSLLDILAEHPEYIPDLRKRLRRKAGRPKGSNSSQTEMLPIAAAEVDRVFELWKDHYGRRNRRIDNPPSAVEIVAARYDLREEAIIKWRKDHPRKSRR